MTPTDAELAARALLQRFLEATRKGRLSVNLRRQFEAEAAEIGPKAMATARCQLAAERAATHARAHA